MAPNGPGACPADRSCHPGLRAAPGPRPLWTAEAQPPQPGGGVGELAVRRARPDVGRPAVAPRVAAEEAHLAADSAQPHQRLAHPGVVDVALAVDEEVVLAEPVA